jgi:8-oxo-dGTP pyrophosphatase MutT (NUDIX family)
VNHPIDADAVFAAEWTLGPDGRYERVSARVVMVDEAERVLLVRARAADGRPGWWFTVGGGIEPDEDLRVAAAREAFEETGVRLEPSELVGPILRRTPEFTFLGRPCRQEELTFLARVSTTDVTTSGWTEVERAGLDGVEWWTFAQLRATAEIVYPPDLADRIEPVLRHGWDGVLVDLGTAREVDT